MGDFYASELPFVSHSQSHNLRACTQTYVNEGRNEYQGSFVRLEIATLSEDNFSPSPTPK